METDLEICYRYNIYKLNINIVDVINYKIEK